ncbi:MerR family transcriptional regulator [Gloeobacter violaceus]|uniref:MerR family transcriptional regulatory protein n=1 Tax=Gloeobacter violaceus (strain ATCC 29082 / PCC 7421) TaxID=251221 RepID=Q7NF69_GLOVI|nr:MerR family transcriptional regulator [Gloeobacter violaceus]BAC91598.1 MerR family transcriptional regulatory protein [Gloeobacter violaceus PCC 7421]
MQAPPWKVGELARQTGLSVRTLHYYDEISLLSPSHYTEGGHRLYCTGDIARLQQIKSLRQLGFSLDEIRTSLERSDCSPLEVLQRHIAHVKEQIELQQRLCTRLEAIAQRLRTTESVGVEDFINTIEAMNMLEKYYTPEQLEELQQRRQQLGEERIRAVEAEWPTLIARVRAEMDRGTDPADPTMQQLARRWQELIEEFTGGNPAINKALRTMYWQEPELRTQGGLDPKIFEYVSRAIAAAKPKE